MYAKALIRDTSNRLCHDAGHFKGAKLLAEGCDLALRIRGRGVLGVQAERFCGDCEFDPLDSGVQGESEIRLFLDERRP